MAASTEAVPFTVEGKSALITGAGSGIGYCFARLLLEKGCNVLIADLALRPEAQKLVDEHSARDSGKPRCAFVKTDVVQWPDLDRMFDVADREFGGADIVCPCAGVFEPHWSNFWIPPSTGVSKDKADPTDTNGLGHYATLDINLTHPIRTTQLAISRFLNPVPDSNIGRVTPANPKRIVHISSIAGQMPGFTTPLYMASKHAISGFIRSLAPLDTLGIRVNGVAPGVIKTPLWTEHPEKLKMLAEGVDEWVEPEEVAEGLWRCCVDGEVDGGYVMEVSKGRTRKVEWRNDPGPTGPGNTAANAGRSVAETFEWLAEEGWGVVKDDGKAQVGGKSVTKGGEVESNGKRAGEVDEVAEGSGAKRRKLRSR
ncbi:Enoyl-(Acyl carrier protein) reductase [Teratosphaeria destructans]|uniref:Enoyl-(Acyl carrier protein) reductase n=1 Tax=Teratosphaeria destructans TaxID=418781 RepID=A0A9W7SUC2_9PEZI|nr:Enoyl-(Acyl carrier protein) reductase [Teratosphaeria destructans]